MQTSTLRRMYLTCEGLCCSAVSLQDLVSTSAWDNVRIFHTNRETMWCVRRWHYSTHTAVCFLSVFMVLKCHFRGYSWPFFKVYVQEPTLTGGYQCICILFDIAFNHAVPWCVLKYKKKWKLMCNCFVFVVCLFFFSRKLLHDILRNVHSHFSCTYQI